MEERGLTQQQVAKVCEVAQPTVQRWLNGTMPGGLEFYLLTKLFDVPAESLLFESENEAAALKERAEETETDIWKRRAKQAEAELTELRDGLRALLTSRNEIAHPAKRRASSKTASELEEHERLLDAAEDKGHGS